MKKQRKEIRLKRKRLKAEYNAALRENRRLNNELSFKAMEYGRKEIKTLAAREVILLQNVIEMGENRMVEIAKNMLAREICEKLKENGAIQFEKDYSPMCMTLQRECGQRKMKELRKPLHIQMADCIS